MACSLLPPGEGPGMREIGLVKTIECTEPSILQRVPGARAAGRVRMAGRGARVCAWLWRVPLLVALTAVAGTARAQFADPASDAPEHRVPAADAPSAPNYAAALAAWNVEELNAWIGAHFRYDPQRAMRLSENQRAVSGGLPIHAPPAFFDSPSGICVDLARFGVESLRVMAPQSRPAYLMIEFAPAAIAGNTLRMHWVAVFEREGRWHVFADSKRPGHLSGPYADLGEFIAEYARHRGR